MNNLKIWIHAIKRINSRDLKLILLEPLIHSLFIICGSTAAIILGRGIIYIIDQFRKFKPNINPDEYQSIWPGIDIFIYNGTILIISFSLLASAAYTTSREMRFNFFSVAPWIVIFFNAIVYSIFITEVNIDGRLDHNLFFKSYSNYVFWVSVLFLYLALIRDQIKKHAIELFSQLSYDQLLQSFRK